MTKGTCSTSRFQTSVCAHEATQDQQSYKHDLTQHTPKKVNHTLLAVSALKVSQHWDSGRFCYTHRANATFLARFAPGKFNYFSVISHRATKRGINKSVKRQKSTQKASSNLQGCVQNSNIRGTSVSVFESSRLLEIKRSADVTLQNKAMARLEQTNTHMR